MQSDYGWHKEYGGLQTDQARRMKDLERENARLRRLVADLSLEGQVPADVASGELQSLSGADRPRIRSKRSTLSRSATHVGPSASS